MAWASKITECAGKLLVGSFLLAPSTQSNGIYFLPNRDAVTPNQDWIISPHPHSENLHIASGGSFHAWKFLPNLGKYVVQMLDGCLDKDLSIKWAWDRSNEGAACEMYIPTRDLKDMGGYEG